MIINEIRKIGIIIEVIGAVLIFLVTFNINYVIAFLLGAFISNINFIINAKTIDLSQSSNMVAKNISSFLIRMIFYALGMILGFLWLNLLGLVFVFIGCLTIRIAIFIFGIKGGIADGCFK